jgi:hypothetical protein
MQRVTFVRYAAEAGPRRGERELARAVFTELKAAARRNMLTHSWDGMDFVHVFINLQGGRFNA